MIIAHERIEGFGSYADQMRDRSGFQRKFHDMILAEPRSKGRVLDIGCGGEMPGPLTDLPQHARQIDGVDPSEDVMKHPNLTLRWHGVFESADIPEHAYGFAYAFNVLEHIPAARPFFEKLRTVLSDQGVFYALTPHAKHPFCKLARTAEILGGKRLGWAKNRDSSVNDYPSYYRLNKASDVLKGIDGLGFGKVTFYYMPCMQWDVYFPRPLRWGPHLYDRFFGTKMSSRMLIFAFKLEVQT
jgi:SAM-dependent methyltransferase